MRCDEFVAGIDLYLDGELSVLEVMRMHGHLVSCDRCRMLLESEAALHSLLEPDVDDEPRSDLRNRVLDNMDATSGRRASSEPRRKRRSWRATAFAGAGLFALVVVTVLAIRLGRPSDVPPFALEMAAKHHLYSDATGPGSGMTTADVDKLTEWLGGRLGFPVKAPRIAGAEQRLIGGRESSVIDTPAAYLLYAWNGHPLSLFVTAPLPDARPEGRERIVRGLELYTARVSSVTLVWWEDSGRLYTAVSRGSLSALEEFALLCFRGERLEHDAPRGRSPTMSGEDIGPSVARF